MQTRFIPATPAIGLLPAAAVGAQAELVKGRASMTYIKQLASLVLDTADHTLLLDEAAGRNRALKGSYMANARVVNRELPDLVQDNGPHQGYITMTAVHWLQGEVKDGQRQ